VKLTVLLCLYLTYLLVGAKVRSPSENKRLSSYPPNGYYNYERLGLAFTSNFTCAEFNTYLGSLKLLNSTFDLDVEFMETRLIHERVFASFVPSEFVRQISDKYSFYRFFVMFCCFEREDHPQRPRGR